MENLFLKYIRQTLPIVLEVNNPDAAGAAAELIFISEKNGNKEFAADKFGSTRERAELCMPYQVPVRNLGKRDHALDVIELLFLRHGQKKHGIDNSKRIDELKEIPLTEEEALIVTMDFWTGGW